MKALNRNYRSFSSYGLILFILLINILTGAESEAQYFGRNKPGYKKFQFDVVQTPHFEIYHYLKNDSLVNALSLWSEKWYRMHQKVFRDTFNLKNPVILYNNHADFQQTNTISGLIGTGTGGVTESLKNRVIMPVAPSVAQTDHVLGHELVHAFQYHMFLKGQSGKEFSLRNIPLWMIEGMAEYLSKGSIDPHTAMVMRDALLNNDFPSIKKLTSDLRYFPYTYGQAFWAMVTKTWGDSVMIPLLRQTAVYGFDRAADSILNVDEKTLSGMWKSATELHFSKYLKTRYDSVAGKKVISDKNAGEMNISPSISPDGRYIAFFSEKDLFTLDLYLSDASTGKIIRKLSSVVRNNEIDDFNSIESSGTWSPDATKFAFVIFSKGTNKLAILDVKKRRIKEEFEIPGVPSFSNPAWSPDGKRIVITGLVNGISDLFLFTPGTGEVEKLTDDFTANLHPSWSSDGRYIVFSQEKVSQGLKSYSFALSILDTENKSIRRIDVFNEAFNMNPSFSSDDRYIYFLSDADGFRNLYKYDTSSELVYRLTEYMTGISGITAISPALSVSRDDRIAYNYFFNDEYHIYLATDSQFTAREIDRHYADAGPATLPPLEAPSKNMVEETIRNTNTIRRLSVDSIKEIDYKPRFKLDYISNNANVGVSTGLYRNNLGGSINMIFSDMVGNNQIYSSLSLNGEIYDFGGQAAYINQSGKIKWGGAISHIPYLTGSMFLTADSINFGDERIPVDNLVIDYMRIFEDNISLFAAYPLSQTRRFEATVSSSWYNYRIDRYNNYYLQNGPLIGGDREKMPAPSGEAYQQISVAYVEDNSFSGMTSPMQGHRQRFQVERYFGDVNLYTGLFDYRKYFYIKPLSLAFRLYSYGLYGKGTQEGTLPHLYLGNPWLIRGYEDITSDGSAGENTFNISWLSGSSIAVANAEVRFPLSGPERLALIKSKFFLADLNLFFDAGMAWSRENRINLDMRPTMTAGDISRSPIMSTGVSLRVNVLGYLVVEPYYAFPLQNGGFRNGAFGLNFIPGW